ncbi:response regulator [Waterburya agarophytonicola K14]|uniref:Response regulator n=1 Tax=Waterburya agarophytonicola KI4 TaxID=2874699 RepID=A0A964FGL9_9CYAN|nr:response regulator [Waterburya agarophytonicola]MCC0178211.1 response regulator [Waterburya agarophytonicola KI4]
MNSSSNGKSDRPNNGENSNLPDKIAVLIVDDQKMIREGLKALVKTEEDIEIVGVAENGEHAVKQVESLKPDVVLMDMEMPGMNGMEATKLICQRFPDVKVLVLSTFDTQEYVSRSLSSGAMGYLLKGTPAKELTDAIRSVHRGYAQIGPGIYRNLSSLPQIEEAQKLPAMSSISLTPPEEKSRPERSYPKGELVTTNSAKELDALVKRNPASAKTRKFEQTVILRRSPKWSRYTIWGIMGVSAFAVIWSYFAKIEQVIPAQGQIQPSGKVQEIQVPTNGVVQEVKVEEGQRVEKGDVLLLLDATTSQAQVDSLNQVRKSLVQENKFYRALLAGDIDASNIDGAIASLEIPREIAYLTRNRAELKDENELFQNLLGNSNRAMSPEQQARLETSQADISERTTSARLEVEQLEKQLEQNKIQVEDTRAQLATGKQNLKEIKERNTEAMTQAKESLAIEEQTLKAILPVFKEGGLSKIQVDQQQQRINDRKAAINDALKEGNLERDRQQQQVTTLQAEIQRLLQEEQRLTLDISQARQQLNNTTTLSKKDLLDQIAANRKRLSEIDSQLNKTIVENDKRIAEINSQVSSAAMNLKYQTITAPVTGDVFDLRAYSGYVPPSGQNAPPVLKIVPTENLVAEIFISPKDIGFVKKGMDTDVRISAFNYSDYGDIDGKVKFISASALEPEPPYDFFRYVAKVDLEQDYLIINGEKQYIQPGMEVQANVRINKDRTVFQLFTSKYKGGIDKFQEVE